MSKIITNREMNYIRIERNDIVFQQDKIYPDVIDAIEELQQENKHLKDKYDCVLKMLADHNPPCELDGFMDKHTDYCSFNCGVDEEIFKKCWDLYIEDMIRGDSNGN